MLGKLFILPSFWPKDDLLSSDDFFSKELLRWRNIFLTDFLLFQLFHELPSNSSLTPMVSPGVDLVVLMKMEKVEKVIKTN